MGDRSFLHRLRSTGQWHHKPYLRGQPGLSRPRPLLGNCGQIRGEYLLHRSDRHPNLMRWGKEWPEKYDLSSLRVLGTVGEPINPEAWVWYHKHIGHEHCPIVDTWWQTETGMIMISPLPGLTATKPGSATRPFPGIEAEVLDEKGQPVGPGGGGYLVLTRPWPAMFRTIYGDPERYEKQYWSKYPGKYFT